jgi:hypothetical protein
MDGEIVKHLWALRKVKGALIDGPKTAVFVSEKWEESIQL